MNIINPLQEKINNSKALDFGTIFSASIELFKKTWLQGFLLQLFTVIIMLPLIIVLYIPMIMMIIGQSQSDNYGSDSFSTFFAGMSILYILFVIVGIIVLGAVSVALNAAFFRIMRALDEGKTVKASDFFYFLNKKHLSKIFMLMLVIILISSIVGFVVIILLIPTLFLSLLIVGLYCGVAQAQECVPLITSVEVDAEGSITFETQFTSTPTPKQGPFI